MVHPDAPNDGSSWYIARYDDWLTECWCTQMHPDGAPRCTQMVHPDAPNDGSSWYIARYDDWLTECWCTRIQTIITF